MKLRLIALSSFVVLFSLILLVQKAPFDEITAIPLANSFAGAYQLIQDRYPEEDLLELIYVEDTGYWCFTFTSGEGYCLAIDTINVLEREEYVQLFYHEDFVIEAFLAERPDEEVARISLKETSKSADIWNIELENGEVLDVMITSDTVIALSSIEPVSNTEIVNTDTNDQNNDDNQSDNATPVDDEEPVDATPTPTAEAPVDVTPTPTAEAPVDATPTPTAEAPVDATPVDDEEPVDATPVDDESPVDVTPTPTAETPVDVTPVDDEASLDETPVEEVLVDGEIPEDEIVYIDDPLTEEESPAEEVPVEESPAEEVPVEESPAEEAPVEESPAEEAPVEESPAEEAPVEESPADDKSNNGNNDDKSNNGNNDDKSDNGNHYGNDKPDNNDRDNGGRTINDNDTYQA
jgi:hypothetical protein